MQALRTFISQAALISALTIAATNPSRLRKNGFLMPRTAKFAARPDVESITYGGE